MTEETKIEILENILDGIPLEQASHVSVNAPGWVPPCSLDWVIDPRGLPHSKVCSIRNKTSLLYCTLTPEHSGKHIAHDTEGNIVFIWYDIENEVVEL